MEDAAVIAKVFLSNGASAFLQLQLGTVDPAVVNEGMTDRMTEGIQKEGQVYIIARDEESGEVVSYAQWTLPRDELEVVVEETPEEIAAETEVFRKKLMPGMNEALILDFRQAIRAMRKRALNGRRHYLLGNLGTLPWYQRRGAASALTSWLFHKADQQGIVVYLDTDQEGNAKALYEKLGFRSAGEVAFDLSQYGGEGFHTHIAMVRDPQSLS